MWNVAGAPPNRTGAPGPDDLGHGDPGQDVDGVEDRRADERHRRDQAHQRDRHDLDRDARLDAVDEVLAGVLAVPEVAGRGDREDRHRAGDQVGAVARNSAIISTIRGTPCSVNAPETTGRFELVRHRNSRQASETWASMSLLVENAVAR